MRPGPALGALAFAALLLQAVGAAGATLEEHGGPVKGVAVAADGERALTASFDYSIILWHLPRREVLAHLYGHDAAVNDVAFVSPALAVSASDDGTVGLWDLEAQALLGRLTGHQGRVTAVAVSPDRRLAASAGWDRTVRVWDLERRAQLHALQGRDNLNAVHFSPDGARLFAGGSDGTVQVWRVADGAEVLAEKLHDFGVTRLDINGRTGATASIDETVQLWDPDDGLPTSTLYGHEGPVLAVALSPDGELVASGGMDGTVRVWRRGDGDRLRVYDRHRGAVWSVAFTPDGETLVSGGADGLVLTYELDQEPEEDDAARRPVTTAVDLPADGGRGAELFRKCVACHTVTPDGGHRAGPSLYGVFGRRAGSHPDYPYSEALEESDVVWTEATVSRLFEVGPDEFVPGSKMPLQRVPDAADRRELVAYLKQITAAKE